MKSVNDDFDEYKAHKSFGKSDDWVLALKEIDTIISETNERINAGEEVIRSTSEQMKNLKLRMKHFKTMRERFLAGKPLVD